MTYPEYLDDYDAWLVVPPPTQLGSALSAIVAEIVGWTPEQRTEAETRFSATYTDAYSAAQQRCVDALDEHPVGEPAACTEITTIEPWTSAILMRVGYGAAYVVQAVAARDHDLISDADFATLSRWWTEAGMPLPTPISDAEREALIEWWAKDGVMVPAHPC